MGIGLIGKAAGDQQTHRLTNQSPAVLVKPERPLRSGSPENVPVKVALLMDGPPLLDSWGQQFF